MDSLIHYRAEDMVKVLGHLVPRSTHALLFTFAPRTPALALMHMIGRAFPRKDRAPAIEPVSTTALGLSDRGRADACRMATKAARTGSCMASTRRKPRSLSRA